MIGKLPNLLIIGAMKSGTTSLHNYLSKHPDIFMSEQKEIHYFSDVNYNSKSLDWYKKQFVTDKKIRGTSPQGYTKCHHNDAKNVLPRLAKTIPDVKMIYIVRDPIERYKSHILEAYHCDPPKDVKYSKKGDSFLKTSMYYMQISAFLKYFKKEQIYVLALEDLQENRLFEMNKIFTFLNVDKLNDNSTFNFVSNAAEDKSIPYVVKCSIPYRAGNKFVPKLTKKIGERFSNIFLKFQMEKPKLSEEQLFMLKQKLKPDIDKFREFTGNFFSKWSV